MRPLKDMTPAVILVKKFFDLGGGYRGSLKTTFQLKKLQEVGEMTQHPGPEVQLSGKQQTEEENC